MKTGLLIVERVRCCQDRAVYGPRGSAIWNKYSHSLLVAGKGESIIRRSIIVILVLLALVASVGCAAATVAPKEIAPAVVAPVEPSEQAVTFSIVSTITTNLGRVQPEFVGLQRYPRPTYGVCAAVRENSFGIDPDGYLYKCWNEIGQKEQSIGSVRDGITNYPRYLKWITFDPTDYPECRDCSILPICNMGNCPDRVLFPKEVGKEKECIPEKWILEQGLLSFLEIRDKDRERRASK